MSAKIYQPAKSAMSSGVAKSRQWILEFAADGARHKDNYTGWNSIDGTANQGKAEIRHIGRGASLCGRAGLSRSH